MVEGGVGRQEVIVADDRADSQVAEGTDHVAHSKANVRPDLRRAVDGVGHRHAEVPAQLPKHLADADRSADRDDAGVDLSIPIEPRDALPAADDGHAAYVPAPQL